MEEDLGLPSEEEEQEALQTPAAAVQTQQPPADGGAGIGADDDDDDDDDASEEETEAPKKRGRRGKGNGKAPKKRPKGARSLSASEHGAMLAELQSEGKRLAEAGGTSAAAQEDGRVSGWGPNWETSGQGKRGSAWAHAIRVTHNFTPHTHTLRLLSSCPISRTRARRTRRAWPRCYAWRARRGKGSRCSGARAAP
jgi:hypothetical protein